MNADDGDRRRRQVERLLTYPHVGALPGPAIASNLGVPAERLQPVLDDLANDGRIVRTADGCFIAPQPGAEWRIVQ